MAGELVVCDPAWGALAEWTGNPPAPFRQDVVLAETDVAGTNHVEAITFKTKDLKAGDELKAVREPLNPFDDGAIRLETAAGVKLGYVPRAINDMPRRLMDAGKKLVFRVSRRAVEDHRVVVEGELVMREG